MKLPLQKKRIKKKFMVLYGATENAGVENSARSNLDPRGRGKAPRKGTGRGHKEKQT